ncbi:hypothetical protein L596_030569 [Steinernema carpocapsae]|uniref:Uncharacterized protein n=1 Tax=Steinernema carpocapsae TaxID=34508 RepID=A0A4U5LPU2_STECR|nr:hypothetical protein L596_030569 [Steinernema carpocapsae]
MNMLIFFLLLAVPFVGGNLLKTMSKEEYRQQHGKHIDQWLKDQGMTWEEFVKKLDAEVRPLATDNDVEPTYMPDFLEGHEPSRYGITWDDIYKLFPPWERAYLPYAVREDDEFPTPSVPWRDEVEYIDSNKVHNYYNEEMASKMMRRPAHDKYAAPWAFGEFFRHLKKKNPKNYDV